MALITTAISPRAFELIRDRIGAILADELANQVLLSADSEIAAVVWIERCTSIDKTEMAALNVSLANGNYNNKHQGSADGTYQFNVDAYVNAKSNSLGDGDSLSAIKLQKLLGVCWAVLENPIYKTLGFSNPFISRVFISSMNIAEPKNDDAGYAAMGRLTLNVMANETTKLIVPSLIEGYNTQVKLHSTNKGYFYQGENY